MNNEFIAWDKSLKMFSDFVEEYQIGDMKTRQCLTFHQYIGKTDMDGNKIYADSSIVEFCFFEDDGDGNMIFNGKHIAYFSFDEVELVYFLKDNSGVGYEFDNSKMKKFKIIDTLQENKLGLIGDKDEN